MARGLSGGGPPVSWAVGLGLVRAVVTEVVMALQVRVGVGTANRNINNYSHC